jgi:HK97 family phage major capsid protein
MDEIRSMLEAVRKELAAKREAAAAARKGMEELFASARAEGVDILRDDEAFAKLDEAGRAYDALRDEIAVLEERQSRLITMLSGDEERRPLEAAGVVPEGVGRSSRPSPGQRFASSPIYKGLLSSGALSNQDIPLGTTPPVKVLDCAELKTLITSGATSGGAFVVPERMEPVGMPWRPVRVLDLITVGDTDSDIVEYVEQAGRTNAAAETAEAGATGDGSGAAPESAVTFAVRQTNVRDITHYLPATKRVLADAGQLQTLIDQELRNGVRDRLEYQVVNGNGTAPNLRGILNTTGILTQALGTDSRSDAIHKAITAVRKEFYEPNAVLLHPDDATDVFLEKDSSGAYIYGPPSQPGPRTIWGLAVVISPVIPAGTGLVGAFDAGATLWVREGLSVSASDSHADFFTRRMVAVLASMRAAFAAQRPKAFCTVTGI